MKKNELVHLHALLALIGEEYVARDIATSADFEQYRSLGITPMSLRHSRDNHEEAVQTLARTLAHCSRAVEQPRSTRTASAQ